MNFTSRSSRGDLIKLAKSIKLSDLVVIRKSEFNKYKDKYENIIINLDDSGPGSHWCAINTKKKIYFDSYNLPAPEIVGNGYREVKHQFEIQSLDSSMCGQLCILFLYYCKKNKLNEFYSLFKDVYKNI